MSHLNMRSLYKSLTDEEFRELFKYDNIDLQEGILYKGKLYRTYEEYEKETEKELILKSLES